jgi:hypothetical protein
LKKYDVELDGDVKLDRNKVPKESTHLNISDPSFKLENEIRIQGHESDLIQSTKKHNISEPLVDRLEETIRIGGHEKDVLDNGHHNISEPSVNNLENEILVNQQNEAVRANEKEKIEPSVGRLEADMMLNNPKFRHYAKLNGKMDIKKAEPALSHLQEAIRVNITEDESAKNKQHQDNKVILPGYESFHGVMVHYDEAFQNSGKDMHVNGGSSSMKPADLEDYKTWLDQENKVSKLLRFRKLHEEFARLSKKLNNQKINIHYDDDDDLLSNDNLKKENLESFNANNLLKLEEKLLQTIKKLEEEETKKKAKIRHDL